MDHVGGKGDRLGVWWLTLRGADISSDGLWPRETLSGVSDCDHLIADLASSSAPDQSYKDQRS